MRLEELLPELREPHLLVERGERGRGFVREGADAEVLEQILRSCLQRPVTAHRRERPGKERGLPPVRERLPAFSLHLLESRVDVVQRPERRDELLRRLLADPPDARDVVRRVAHERQDVDHAGRRHAEEPGDARLVQEPLLHGMPDGDGRVLHELEEVLVGGGDLDAHARARGRDRDRTDEVVRLVARLLDDGEAEEPADPLGVLDLRHEIVRHRLPLGLVARIQLFAERLLVPVEAHGDRFGLPRLAILPPHVQEAVDGIRGPAPRARQPADRVERAIEIVRRVEERQRRESRERIRRWILHRPRVYPATRALMGPPPRPRARDRDE